MIKLTCAVTKYLSWTLLNPNFWTRNSSRTFSQGFPVVFPVSGSWSMFAEISQARDIPLMNAAIGRH